MEAASFLGQQRGGQCCAVREIWFMVQDQMNPFSTSGLFFGAVLSPLFWVEHSQ